MAKRKHIIYIPGLGDTKATWQKRAVNTWQLWGVQPHTFRMVWADGELFAPKFERLLQLIDGLYQESGQPVGLVCASAGASAALPAYAARQNKVSGVVCIAGKIHNPAAIGGVYYSRNPAFVEGAHQVADALRQLDHDTILSIRATFDPIVPARDSYLEGAHNRVVITMGHAITIGTQLVFGAPRFIRFLKQR